MSKLHYCELCEELATYTIQPNGGSISYWCTKHYNQTVKSLVN